jgi:hypothetical protein
MFLYRQDIDDYKFEEAGTNQIVDPGLDWNCSDIVDVVVIE